MAQAQKEKPLTSQEIDAQVTKRLVNRGYSDQDARMVINYAKTMAGGRDTIIPANNNINRMDLNILRDFYLSMKGKERDGQKYLLATGPLFKGPSLSPQQRLAVVPKREEAPKSKPTEEVHAVQAAALVKKETKAPVRTTSYDVTLPGGTFRIATNQELPAGKTTFQTNRQARLNTWTAMSDTETPIASVTLPSGVVVKPGDKGYLDFVIQYRKEFHKMEVAEQSGKEFKPIPIEIVSKQKKT